MGKIVDGNHSGKVLNKSSSPGAEAEKTRGTAATPAAKRKA